MTSPPPLLPVTTSTDAHAPPIRVNPLYVLGFLATTISTSLITYLAYNQNDTPMLLFTSFIYVVYFSVDFSPLPPAPSARATHVRLFLWAIFSAGMLAFACSFWTVLTLHESLCFFWVVIGGSALLFSAWSGDSKFAAKKEQYSDMVQSFGPIMLMFFGLGRRYVTTQLIPFIDLSSEIKTFVVKEDQLGLILIETYTMAMFDSLFNKGFKAAKCKTLLKLTIPRIKLLRNRRENQLKNMRRDIAKLLETGQEATARIRVEHIIREENMMAAQEIIELFCELIAVRLPIIESQRECPLDLKEAISSVCFAAPRCADLPELLQVQMLFAAKYGKEFLSAATELRPDCGVNRQLIELLSIRAPSPEKKLNLLKEIAVEHDLEWDPAASETEFFKKHEDLLNGPTQFFSGSKLPLPDEKPQEEMYSSHETPNKEEPDSDSGSDTLEFPEVPKVSVRPNANVATAPEIVTHLTMEPLEVDLDSSSNSGDFEDVKQEQVEDRSTVHKNELHTSIAKENIQFVPFISPPALSSGSFSARPSDSSPTFSSAKSEPKVDLQDVLAAAHAAAETAERAAAAARTAASLAQIRINELTKKRSDEHVSDSSSENPFYAGGDNESPKKDKHFTEQNSAGNSDVHNRKDLEHYQDHYTSPDSHSSSFPSFNTLKEDYDSSPPSNHVLNDNFSSHQPKRLPSMDDDSYFSYPNLFTSQNSSVGSQTHSDHSRSPHDL